MGDAERKELAREAGDGDLSAARRLVAVLEREADPLCAQVMAAVRKDDRWQAILDVVRANATGQKLWLVGGKVYRTLAEILHGKSAGAWDADFDFLAEDKTQVPLAPYADSSWRVHDQPVPAYSAEVGARKFEVNGRELADLLTFRLPARTQNERSLDGYFATVPLNVQAVAIDLDSERLLGPGIAAIREKSVAVNHEEWAKASAKRAGATVDDLVTQRAISLGFQEAPKSYEPYDWDDS